MSDSDHYLCTCCDPPRPMDRESSEHEWAHLDDETFAEVFHVHVSSASSDCDGPHESEQTVRIPNLRWFDGELSYKTVPEPDAHDLWHKMCRLSPYWSSPTTIRIIENMTDDGTYTMEWQRSTDEGYDAQSLTGCKNPDCAHDDSSQRDRFAESMNY